MLSPDLAFSVCSPVERRDNKMFPGKTSVVLAGIHQCLGLQVQAFAALSVLCCPSGAVSLALEEEANIRIRLPWPWNTEKLSGSLCSEPGMYWGCTGLHHPAPPVRAGSGPL